MTDRPQPPRKTSAERWIAATVEAHGGKLHPLFGTPLFDAVTRLTDQHAPTIAKLRALKAGKRNPNPIDAPSLLPLMTLKRRGRTLAQVLDDMRTGKRGGGSWDTWLEPFCMQPIGSHYTNVRLNIGVDNRHENLFLKAFGENWRATIAADAFSLDIKYMNGNKHIARAFAVFYDEGADQG